MDTIFVILVCLAITFVLTIFGYGILAIMEFSYYTINRIKSIREKEKPKPLKYIKEIGGGYKLFSCPNCKQQKYITNSSQHHSYCPRCGQKLDFEKFIYFETKQRKEN